MKNKNKSDSEWSGEVELEYSIPADKRKRVYSKKSVKKKKESQMDAPKMEGKQIQEIKNKGVQEEPPQPKIVHNIKAYISKNGTKWLRKRIQDYRYDLKTGKWTFEEDLIFAEFMQENKKEFQFEYTRRKYKVFQRLSEKLGRKRSSEQCRSHHQKIQKKIKSSDIEGIIQQLRIDQQNASQKKAQVKKGWQTGVEVCETTDQYKVVVMGRKIILEININELTEW